MKTIFVSLILTDEEFDLLEERRKREKHPSIKKMVIDFVKRHLAVAEAPRYQFKTDVCNCDDFEKRNGHLESCPLGVPRM